MQEEKPEEFVASSGGSNVMSPNVCRRHFELHCVLNTRIDIL
jgi:hypothetical protein